MEFPLNQSIDLQLKPTPFFGPTSRALCIRRKASAEPSNISAKAATTRETATWQQRLEQIPIGSMVLLYMVTWIPSIYPNVSIFTVTYIYIPYLYPIGYRIVMLDINYKGSWHLRILNINMHNRCFYVFKEHIPIATFCKIMMHSGWRPEGGMWKPVSHKLFWYFPSK